MNMRHYLHLVGLQLGQTMPFIDAIYNGRSNQKIACSNKESYNAIQYQI
jgi:hypothetical protein